MSQAINDIKVSVEKTKASLEKDIALLQVKSGVWGAVAGLIPAAVVAFYFILRK